MARKQPSRDPLADALTELGALAVSALDPEDAQDIQHAIMGIMRIRARRGPGPKVRKMRRGGQLVPALEAPRPFAVTPLPRENPYFGMGMRQAVYHQLTLVPKKHTQSAKDIWAALDAAGFSTAHNDPVNAVHTALRRRAKTHADVFLVGGGKWGLKSWYAEEELEEIRKSVGGMGGRDAAEHSERTKAGMRVALTQRGVRVGKPPFLTPERMEEVKQLVRDGVSVTEIAKRYDITTNAIYNYLDRETLRRLRMEGLSKSAEDAASNRVMN